MSPPSFTTRRVALSRLAISRPQLKDLLYVLLADYPGPLDACPLEADPRQIADLALARLAAGLLAVVRAVR